MMHTTLQRAGHAPYSTFVIASVLLLAATAYPKPLDVSGPATKEKQIGAQCSSLSSPASDLSNL